jgi:serine protease Do
VSSSTSSKKNSSTSNNSAYDAKLMDLAEYSETAVAVAESVLPSVVGITVTYNVSSVFGSSGSATATGSGVIISEDGYIITNNHVVNSESSSYYYQVTEATGITVHLYGDDDDVLYDAEVVGSDSSTDLAVLKINAEDLQAITIGDSDNLRVGEFVMAVGNPLNLDSSVTAGIISALNREVTDSDGNTFITIQTDAAINSGNSGGALVNSKGELIGINSMKLSGDGIEGIGFAMPINSSMNIINQLIEYGIVKRPYIGIGGRNITESLAKQYDYPVGIYVQEVYDDTPAKDAGIEAGDVITAINGEDVTTMDELNSIKNKCEIGDEITLKVYRDGKYKDFTLTLAETPETDDEEESSSNSSNSLQDYYDNYDKNNSNNGSYFFNPFNY